jgi:hypothetical protein
MIEMLQKKIRDYGAQNGVEEENAIKEMLQEIALYALWRTDFFDVALFQGGTSLRILHGLPRFSEDLDFLLRAPDAGFQWARYLAGLVDIFSQFGLKLDAQPKDKMDRAIREAILKDDSIANQLNLSFPGTGKARTIRIKLEIDTNPPAGSTEETSFLDFPADYEVRHQDLASNFALKIHALLCRPYLKGRDWFDFSWYAAQGTQPNLPLLGAALRQAGPWTGEAIDVDTAWVTDALKAKIGSVDWTAAASDVSRFLRQVEAKSLSLWSERFFFAKLDQVVAKRSD